MTGTIYLAIVGFGVLLCLLRMLKGPTAPDRAVALDTAVTLTTALLVMYIIDCRQGQNALPWEHFVL